MLYSQTSGPPSAIPLKTVILQYKGNKKSWNKYMSIHGMQVCHWGRGKNTEKRVLMITAFKVLE